MLKGLQQQLFQLQQVVVEHQVGGQGLQGGINSLGLQLQSAQGAILEETNGVGRDVAGLAGQVGSNATMPMV